MISKKIYFCENIGLMDHLASLLAQMVKSLEDPLEKEMATHPTFLPGKFHGQRSLAGCSPWGRKELDETERLTLSLSR